MPTAHRGSNKIIGKTKADAANDELNTKDPMTPPMKNEIKLSRSARTLQM